MVTHWFKIGHLRHEVNEFKFYLEIIHDMNNTSSINITSVRSVYMHACI